jgi:hypothetical protein
MPLEQLQQRAKSKQNETEASLATGRLKNHEGYSAAVRRLDELSIELKAHIDQKERIKASMCREPQEAQIYTRNEPRVWDNQDDVAVLAKTMVRTGKLPSGLDAQSKLISGLHEPDARPAALKFDFERRAIDVCEYAVMLHKKTVLAQKRQAIADICAALRPKYQPIARRVAEALLELGSALEEERAFSHQLMSEDAELAHGLRPRPFFPVGILSSPDLYAWISEAIAEGLIDPTDPRAHALGAASKATA